ncbi:sulfur carrier protein ThiS [Shewanella sp. AS16]|uniref:sulfur carrier protein ThiS n=1 Tax=Shewanella sp. AS16 TaxID=2907625 RepID=UPI001F3F4398|nr:sulfur carrier protein ThiS [Shewanella sp. AS16]MCE9687406.1 sulfur carrier protein ThiS [Shewanella sp. AS16]
MISIQLNGEPLAVPEHASLAAVLHERRLDPNAFALVLNAELVPRNRWQHIQCRAGDKLELFSAVAGG